MKRKSRRARPYTERAAGAEPVSPTGKTSSRRYYFAAAFALALATLLAYSNSFSTGFALDNQTLVLEDTRVQTASAANLILILRHTYWWPNGESGLYRPLTTLTYLLNYAILGNGNHPAWYHWVNLLLHASNVLLVFALVWRLVSGRANALRIAFFAALLWAVHPVLTESVTNIVGRADLLAAFGLLAGFLCYLKSAEATGGRRALWLAGLAVATATGVFSKESAVVLPGVLALYELACKRRWRILWPGLAATLAPIGVMLWQRATVLSSSLPAEYPFPDNPIAGAGFWAGRLTALQVLGRYVWLALCPLKLSADYSYSQIPLARGSLEDWLGWLTIAGAAALAAISWKSSRMAFFLAGFAFLNLLPASNLLFPIGTTMAERFLYLPLVGAMALTALLLEALAARLRFSGVALAICAAVIAAGFALRTWRRNLDWTDDQSMAIAGVQTSPRSFKFHRLLAAQLLSADPPHHGIDRAMAEADRSVAILAPLPDELDVPGPWNLAAVCHRVKADTMPPDQRSPQYEEAAKLARRSIAIDKASRARYDRRHGIQSPVPAGAAEGYRTLASACLHLNRPREALSAAMEAQTIDPANSGVYEEIADAQIAQERPEEAAIAFAEGMLATGDRNLLDELESLYQHGVDSKGCAIKAGPHGPTLNPECEIVHHDLCEATLRIHRDDLRRRMACRD